MGDICCFLRQFVKGQSTYFFLRRHFSLCSHEKAKSGAFLHKLLDKSKKRHPQQYLYVLPNSAVPSTPKKVQERTRRQRVLNTVFMESLSNIMVTGTISEKLKGFAIELTQVRVSSDCTHLNVYWVTALKEPGVDEKVAEILHSNAGYLKSELIKNGFIGKAPKIAFVKDVTYGRASEVEALIDKVCADLPPDLDNPTLADKQASSDEETSTVDSSQTGPFVPPEMKMDVYGLDRAALMRQVLLKSRGQSKAPLEELAPLKPGTHNSDEAQARMMNLAEYVRQRKRKSNLQAKAEREAQRNLQSVQLSPYNEHLSSATPDPLVEPDDTYDEDEHCNVSFLKED
uniref:Uncharacterized protein n=1 Tax=Rhipicephalus pulchellus TaxID=72859 RepID=L7LXU4_RHIPC